jgi:hypothetical protein
VEKAMIAQHLSIDHMKDSLRAPWSAGECGAIAREIVNMRKEMNDAV